MVTVVALVAATVSVEDCPAVIEGGVAVIFTVGAGADAATVTVAVAVAGVVPAAPVAVAV
jgi:hypothetical protein